MTPPYPNYEELLDACTQYAEQEQGDTNYEIACKWIDLHWSNATRMAGGLRILEETWNRGFYQYGIFNMQLVIRAIEQCEDLLCQLRLRQIETFNSADEKPTQHLWSEFFPALKPRARDASPFIATAKALHILVPSFYVPFDSDIAKKYNCNIEQPRGFIQFQHQMAEFANHVLDSFIKEHGGDRSTAKAKICGSLYLEQTGSHYVKSLAKLLDEYNWLNRKK